MSVVLVGLAFLVLFKIKPQKNKHEYLNPESTRSILGIFAIIIFCSHFFSYIPLSSLKIIDKPLFWLTSQLQQLMVSPFLFFSGYGIFEQYKNKGIVYGKKIPKNRLLKVYLSFFVAWIIYAAISLYFRNEYSLQTYLLSLFAIDSIGNSNWYVLVILLLYSVSYLSINLLGNDRKKVFFSHVLLIPALYLILYRVGCESWWYNTIMCYLFGVGYSFFKDKIDSFLVGKKYRGVLLFFSSFLLFAGFYIVNNRISLLFLQHIVYIFVNLFFCLTIVFFLYLFKIGNKLLLFLGSSCFWIYILQRIPMILFNKSPIISSNIYIFFSCCFTFTLLLAFIFYKSFNYSWKLIANSDGNIDEGTNIKIGIVISYISLFVSVIGGFVVTPLILEVLGDSQYGLRSFALSISSWLTIVSTALAASYLRFTNKSIEPGGIGIGKNNTLYLKLFSILGVVVFTITIIGTGVCFIFNIGFNNYSLAENRLILLLILISGINLCITFVFTSFSHFLTFKKEFIFIRGLALIISLSTYFFEIIFAMLTKSIVSVVIVTTSLNFISGLITLFFAIKIKGMKFEKERIRDDKNLIKSIIVFSSFILLNAVVDQINKEVDITILGVMVNAESVTAYTLARYFSTYMVSLSIAISGTYAPKIHEFVRKKDMGGLNDLFNRVSILQMIIMFAVVGGFASCGYDFMFIWLGDSKSYIYFYSLVLLSLNIIPLSCNLGIETQRAMNKHKFRAILYIVLALLNIGISIFLIAIFPKEMAIWGAILGTVFSITFGNIIVLNIYNHKVIGLNMLTYFKNIAKYFLLTVIAVAPAIIIRFFLQPLLSHVALFLLCALIFVIIYFVELMIIDKKIVMPIIKNIYLKLK